MGVIFFIRNSSSVLLFKRFEIVYLIVYLIRGSFLFFPRSLHREDSTSLDKNKMNLLQTLAPMKRSLVK